MKSRIRAILNYYNISQSTFAQRIGVTKGLISHIMAENGRGGTFRESTFDRIIEAFPEINRQWLHDGVGSMLKKDTDGQASLFDNVQPSAEAKPKAQKPIDSRKPQESSSSIVEEKYSLNAESDSEKLREYPNEQKLSGEPQRDLIDEKPSVAEASETKGIDTDLPRPNIERIVIFYSDGTFTEHLPKA